MMKSMRLVIFGAEGQLGSALQLGAHSRGWSVLPLSRVQADITNPASMARACEQFEPSLVINAAAYTAVDAAETNPRTAYLVNERGAENVARLARDLSVPLLHVSTDYVFDGTQETPYDEFDTVNPLGVYGESKLAGERLVLEAHESAFVFRTSCVYGGNPGNFFRAIVDACRAGKTLTVVDDQVGSPTLDTDLAHALLCIAPAIVDGGARLSSRLYHLCGREPVSRYRWAASIVEEAEAYLGALAPVQPVRTKMYIGQARRPMNSSLSSDLLFSTFGIEVPGWRSRVSELMHQIIIAPSLTGVANRRAIA